MTDSDSEAGAAAASATASGGTGAGKGVAVRQSKRQKNKPAIYTFPSPPDDEYDSDSASATSGDDRKASAAKPPAKKAAKKKKATKKPKGPATAKTVRHSSTDHRLKELEDIPANFKKKFTKMTSRQNPKYETSMIQLAYSATAIESDEWGEFRNAKESVGKRRRKSENVSKESTYFAPNPATAVIATAKDAYPGFKQCSIKNQVNSGPKFKEVHRIIRSKWSGAPINYLCLARESLMSNENPNPIEEYDEANEYCEKLKLDYYKASSDKNQRYYDTLNAVQMEHVIANALRFFASTIGQKTEKNKEKIAKRERKEDEEAYDDAAALEALIDGGHYED